ncbi:MAG TPA: polysaccharide biosynthesis/export family protein [Bryobacteraceae bacterium]|nr:polysaccharide biosynthesis/export family protein [Bryobacteraceae bacterium]
MRLLVKTTFAFTLAGAVLFGQQQVAAITPKPASSQPADRAQYVLGPDDSIKIWALGVDEITDKPVKIDPNGYIDLPLVGRVEAGGLTVEQLEQTLLKRLVTEVRQPRVSVEVVEFGSQPVTIIGAVNQPGVHQLRGSKTLAEVLSMAGGLKPDCGPRINISRSLKWGPIPLPSAKTDSTGKFSIADVSVKELIGAQNPALNIQVEANDVITVPQAEMVYVIGEVKKPGGIILNEKSGVSVLEALSYAEGLGATPAAQKSKILRPVPGATQRQEIALDLKKVLAGKGEDMELRPNDILFIPTNTPKKAVTRALEAAVQTATGVVIWRMP